MPDDGAIRVFGFNHPVIARQDTPTGEECGICGVPIKWTDEGVTMIHGDADRWSRRPWHWICFMRHLGLASEPPCICDRVDQRYCPRHGTERR